MADEAPEEPVRTKAAVTKGTSAPDPEARRKRSAWWVALTKKQVAVIALVIGGAMTATFSNGLQNLFTGLLPDGWDEPGSGIRVVDVRRQPMSGAVVIPESVTFADMADARRKVNDPEWEAQHEWYAAGRVIWEVTLVGRHNDPVVITDLRPERTGPCTKTLRDGTLVDDISAGEGEKIELTTAIDATVPELLSAKDGSAYFDGGNVTLEKGETVIVSIEATSASKTCEWVLDADYVDNGKRESMTIKAPGDRPFAITGLVEDRPYDRTWNSSCKCAMTREEAAMIEKPADCI